MNGRVIDRFICWNPYKPQLLYSHFFNFNWHIFYHYIMGNLMYVNIVLYSNIVLFRRSKSGGRRETLVEMSSGSLMNSARRIMKECRMENPDTNHDLLVPRVKEDIWSKNGAAYKANLIRELTGRYPVMNQFHDAECMDKYLQTVMQDGLQDPGLVSPDQFLPAGSSILDFLAVSTERRDTWRIIPKDEISAYQRNRGLSYAMLEEIEVREIILGVSTEDEVNETVHWFWRNYTRDQTMYPSTVISMDCEELKISLFDIYRLAGKMDFSPGRKISPRKETSTIPGFPKDEWKQLPVKTMFGNGLSYALIISINLERDQYDTYILSQVHVQDSVIDFLNSVPLCTGLGVKEDVAEIELYFGLFSGKPVNMKGFVDLSELAVMAGYALRSRSMTTLGIQVLGTVLNKMVSTGDDKWSWAWEKLPDSLKVYALGDLRMGYMTYNILSAVIIQDYFPDPEVVCKYFDSTDQGKVGAWILDLLAYTMDGLELHQEDFKTANTRIEMMKCLRFRYAGSSELMEDCPPRVRLWIKMLGDWPAVSAGGCRFLLQCRSWFVTQASILKRSGYSGLTGVSLSEPSEYLTKYARFGIPLDHINELDFSTPVPNHYGLVHPGSRMFPLLSINPRISKCSSIGKFCSKQPRVQKMIIFEWARTNSHRILDFLQRMNQDLNYKKFYSKLYDGIRQIYQRLYGKEAVRVPELDEKHDENLISQLDVELVGLEKSAEEHEVRLSRIHHIRRYINLGDQVERSLWRRDLPELPTRGSKRGRERSRSKSGARKPRRKLNPGSLPEQDGSKPLPEQDGSKSLPEQDVSNSLPEQDGSKSLPEQDGSNSLPEQNGSNSLPEQDGSNSFPEQDAVVIQDLIVKVSEDQLEVIGVNNPKPIREKKSLVKGRKKKGKRSGSRIVCSYDQMIEARPIRMSDDEFDLEMEFSEFLN